MAIRTMLQALKKTQPKKRIETDDARWAAVVAKDPACDGKFVVCVATTGIYCRPNCPARLPKRENVSFRENCDDAEVAGYRACKRCKPREIPRTAKLAQVMADACRTIENSENQPLLKELAADAGMSPFHFQRLFKDIVGVTPKGFATAHRHKRVRETLKSAGSVTDGVFDAGFNSSGRFYASSNKVLGMTPKAYKAGGAATEMRFSVGTSLLGKVLVAASAKGVSAIFLGDEPGVLVRELRERFPNANLIGGDKAFARLVTQVIAFVEAPRATFDLPLDVQGTAFQHRVWQALRDIPAGSTASYTDIAMRIGNPKAVRAVAGACAANPVAVAIPCHRVVRSDGGLSGYRWGVKRKRRLLEREAKG